MVQSACNASVVPSSKLLHRSGMMIHAQKAYRPGYPVIHQPYHSHHDLTQHSERAGVADGVRHECRSRRTGGSQSELSRVAKVEGCRIDVDVGNLVLVLAPTTERSYERQPAELEVNRTQRPCPDIDTLAERQQVPTHVMQHYDVL